MSLTTGVMEDLVAESDLPRVRSGSFILCKLRERAGVEATFRLGRHLNYSEGGEDEGHERQVFHICSEVRLSQRVAVQHLGPAGAFGPGN
jgi:hypothetical protein